MPSMQEDRTCYVGNLSKETDDRTIEDAFAKYGRVRSVWVARKPHGFAFVGKPLRTAFGSPKSCLVIDHRPLANTSCNTEFDDAHDAADAAKGLNGGKIAGDFVRVELKGRGSRGPPQRSEHRIVIRNLPRQCSWQDLKSTFRQICEPGFVELIGNGEAVAEFPTKEDMREIIKRFDNDEFFGNLITIIEDDGTHRPPSPQPARRRDSDRGYDRGGRDSYRGGGGGGGRGYDDRYGGDYDRRDYRRDSRRSRSRDRDRSRSRGRY